MNYEEVPGRAAVFPLPNCVLFPKVLLPLRIFEPRYKLMVQDVLDSAGWIVMALWQEGREYNARGNPDVFPVAGLGRVADYHKAADGTYKIVLWGEHRVRLKDWIRVHPYAIATLEKFPELEPEEPERSDIRGRMRSIIKGLLRHSGDSQVLKILEQTIQDSEDVGQLVDHIAYHYLSSSIEKQRLLEIPEVARREEKLLELLSTQKQKLGETP